MQLQKAAHFHHNTSGSSQIATYSWIAIIRTSDKEVACRILNHAKFDRSERLPERELYIALLFGSPTRLTTLLKAVFSEKGLPYFEKPHTSDNVAQGWFPFQKPHHHLKIIPA